MIEFFKTLYAYRGILFYRTLASLRADARGMYLGYLWWFLEPVLNTTLYYFIFGVLLGSKTPDFIAYLLIGTVVYQWFQSSLMSSMGTITSRAHLYRKIPLPKYLFALIVVCTNSWKFLCVFFTVVVVIVFSTDLQVNVHLLWVPLIVLLQLAVITGISINLSIAAAYFRDMSNVIGVLFRALMFVSAIFWDVEKVPEHLRLAFFLNPVASAIDLFRACVLRAEAPSGFLMLYLLCFSL